MIEELCLLASWLVGLGASLYFPEQRRTPASLGLCLALALLACWLILPLPGLYFLAREYQAIYHVWPQPMLNDPKHSLNVGYATYDALSEVVDYLFGFALVWLVNFSTLFFVNRPRFSRGWKWAFWIIFSVSILVFLCDFGALFTWWLD